MYMILFYQISRQKRKSIFYLRTEYILNERVSYIKMHIKGSCKRSEQKILNNLSKDKHRFIYYN